VERHLVTFCQRPEERAIQFTRLRPSKKEDNAQVEQANWTPVCRLVDWDRDDTQEAQQALTDLSVDLRLFRNLFQPSMKLQRKHAAVHDSCVGMMGR